MRAVLHTGVPCPWAEIVPGHPWCLLPIGNRPWLEYWLELCGDLGAHEVWIVLGDGAEEVEAFAGDGTRWGLSISYSFHRNGAADPAAFLRRDPARWGEQGLLFVAAPVFFRRAADYRAPAAPPAACAWRNGGRAGAFAGADPAAVAAFVAAGDPGLAAADFATLGFAPELLDTVKKYFELNMALVGGESERYVTPGYLSSEGSYVGYNAILPPAANMQPPLMIGDCCRIEPLATVGPRAVLGRHVIADRQCELSECVVLDATYIGRGVELKRKIASGTRLIDPEDGTFIDIGEAWLLGHSRGAFRFGDMPQAVFGWLLALGLVLLMLVPFALVYPLVRATSASRFRVREMKDRRGRMIRLSVFEGGRGGGPLAARLFRGLSLDRLPALLAVLSGRLWLCGNEPLPAGADDGGGTDGPYFPGAFTPDEQHLADAYSTVRARADALYYARFRSLREDLRILIGSCAARWSQSGAD